MKTLLLRKGILQSIFFMVLGVTLFSCSSDNDDDPQEPMVFSATVSATQVDVGADVTFTDNSTGVKSRIWTFPSGSIESSADQVVHVRFSFAGPATCNLVVTFNDDTTESKEFTIRIGNELYRRSIFGFEDDEAALGFWTVWNSSGNDDIVTSIDKTQGANGTSNCLKITVNNTGNESQIFTKGNELPYNATLESNKSYVFSFWVKSDNITYLDGAEISNESSTQTWYNFVWASPVPVTNTWTKVEYTFETGDISDIYTEKYATNAYAQFKIIPTQTGVVYIDEVSISEVK